MEPSDKDKVLEIVDYYINWEGIPRTILLNFPEEIIKNVAYRLFLSSSYISRKVAPNSTVFDYTEIEKDGCLFRVYPCFS